MVDDPLASQHTSRPSCWRNGKTFQAACARSFSAGTWTLTRSGAVASTRGTMIVSRADVPTASGLPFSSSSWTSVSKFP